MSLKKFYCEIYGIIIYEITIIEWNTLCVCAFIVHTHINVLQLDHLPQNKHPNTITPVKK